MIKADKTKILDNREQIIARGFELSVKHPELFSNPFWLTSCLELSIVEITKDYWLFYNITNKLRNELLREMATRILAVLPDAKFARGKYLGIGSSL